MFFKSVAIESEGQLADAIECENPVLLKALKVYLFYSVEYMQYLSIDVGVGRVC